MFALLDESMADILAPKLTGRRRNLWTSAREIRRAEAVAWVFDAAADDGDLLFSFANVCSVLEIDSVALRRQLREHVETKEAA